MLKYNPLYWLYFNKQTEVEIAQKALNMTWCNRTLSMKENPHKLIPMALNKITSVETKQKSTQLNLPKAFNRVALQIIESQVLGYYAKRGQVHKAAQAYSEYKHLM